MFCGKCGLKLSDDQIRCPRCGSIAPGAITPEPAAAADPDTPPEVVLPPDLRQQAPRPQRNLGKLIGLIALAVLVVGAVGFLIGLLIYHNSDGYKMGQAVTAVTDGKLDEGLDYLRDVSSPEADAVRQYCEIEKQRSAFFDNYQKDMLQGFDSPAKVSYDKLMEAYNNVKSSDDLPEKLKNRYNRYNTRLMDMSCWRSESAKEARILRSMSCARWSRRPSRPFRCFNPRSSTARRMLRSRRKMTLPRSRR